MPITDDLKSEAWAPASDLPLVLLLIEHDDLAQPIRVVNNNVNVVSNGETFIAFPFDILLPDSLEDAPPKSTLRISNVSREIGEALRSIQTPADITIMVVRQDDTDVLEMEFEPMSLANVKFDALTVTGDLQFENLTREKYPAYTFSPAEYPGLI